MSGLIWIQSVWLSDGITENSIMFLKKKVYLEDKIPSKMYFISILVFVSKLL